MHEFYDQIHYHEEMKQCVHSEKQQAAYTLYSGTWMIVIIIKPNNIGFVISFVIHFRHSFYNEIFRDSVVAPGVRTQ